MWRLASAAVLIAVLTLAAASSLTSRADTPTPTPDASPSASPSPAPSPELSPEPTAEPTPEALPPTPPQAPPEQQPAGPPQASIDPAYAGSLHPGDWVQITGTGSCLNLRWEPLIPTTQPDDTTHDNVINCLPDGFIGRLDASGWGRTTIPVLENGRWWWHILGQGWAADEWLTLHHQGGIPWPERPELASAGLVAYIGTDNGIWLMNADGSSARRIRGGDPNQWVQALQWSPQGDRLSFSGGGPGGSLTTLIMDLNGSVVTEIPGLSDPRWSPGGAHLSGVRSGPSGDGGYQAIPVVFDLDTASEWSIGPATHGYLAPVWSPDGNSLAFVCTSGYVGQLDGTTVVDEARNCHGDGLRVVSVDGSNPRVLLPTAPPDGGYISGPSWSPSGDTIAVTSTQQRNGCRGYALVDIPSALVTGCITPAGMATFVGGGCGGPGMSNPYWTVDGRLVFSAPGAGRSGVFVHDIASAAETFIPSMSAWQISTAPDGLNMALGVSGHIWVAGLDDSNLTLLAEGHSPAWQPLP